MKCEYLVTKRAGRKHESRQPKDKPNGTQPSLGSGWPTSMLPSPDLTQSSPRHQNISSRCSDKVSNCFSHLDSTSPSDLTTLSPDFGDFFASPLSFPPVLDPSNTDFLAQSTKYGDTNTGLLDFNDVVTLPGHEDTFSIIENAVFEFPPSLANPRSSQASRDSTTVESLLDIGADSPCCCLVRALGLLKHLFPSGSRTCTRSRRQSYDSSSSYIPTIHSVVTENAETIDAISNMLQCPCSQDMYLLSVMSLIVFKVLGWYAAAARGTSGAAENGARGPDQPQKHRRHSSCHSEQVQQLPAVVGSYCIDGEDQARMAAQLVLSELHRAQRLVNLLSSRLKEHKTHSGTRNGATDGGNALVDGELSGPFSTSILEQLEADLRKRLRALSLEIVEMLRQG